MNRRARTPNFSLRVRLLSHGSQRFTAQLEWMRRGLVFATLLTGLACADNTGPGSPSLEQSPAISISRGSLLFNEYDNFYAIIVADSTGGMRKRLSPLGSLDIDPAVSADGTRIVFASALPNAHWFDLWVMNADGTNRVRLTEIAGGSYRPAWSPDGKRIAFQAYDTLPYWQIYVINSNGTGLVQITNAVGNSADPEWSPDGTRIVFARDAYGFENKGIFTMNPDGSDVRQLTSGHFDRAPSWSPDGNHIAFTREDLTSWRGNLFTLEVNKSSEKQLTQSFYAVTDPTWAPDGKTIAYTVVSESRMCKDDEYGTGEIYACGNDLRRVTLEGVPVPNWLIVSAYNPTWRR